MKKCLLFGLLIAVLPISPAWPQASDEATLAAVQAFSAGQEAAQKQDWDTAIPALEKALSLNPELFLAHYYLGAAYISKKDIAKGTEHFQAFVQKAESDPGQAAFVARAQRVLGLQFALDKKWAEAIPYLKKVVEAKGDDVEARARLAQALLATKDEAAAEEQLVKLMELNPKGAVFFFQAGVLAYQRKDDAAAKQRLDAFVALTPTGPQAAQAYFMLGQIARRANDNEAAKGYFEKYLATNPAPSQQVDGVKLFLDSLKAGTAAPPAQ
jgi:tetratricopeptide (TPR) repeat protein